MTEPLPSMLPVEEGVTHSELESTQIGWQRSSTLAKVISLAVAEQYEAFPYPRYNLLAKPRLGQGYMVGSPFARCLVRGSRDLKPTITPGPVLLAGCGEMLPYLAHGWERPGQRLVCVDLSGHSLRRARIRLGIHRRPLDWVHENLDDYLENRLIQTKSRRSAVSPFGHIDAYGVLHHVPRPARTLSLLAASLHPTGTIRLMVYNTEARKWIHHIQRAFHLIGLSPFVKADLVDSRRLLAELNQHAPPLAEHLRYMGPGTINNDARLVDTFFHAREARLSLSRWFEIFASCGLKIAGLVDRYAELDDLPNPLWQPPDAKELEERVADGRFENNLELFLTPTEDTENHDQHEAPRSSGPGLMALRTPPHLWFSFTETQDIPSRLRRRLWHQHLQWVFGGEISHRDLFWKLPRPCLKRLVRIGAILPGQTAGMFSRDELSEPLAEIMTPPDRPRSRSLWKTPVAETVRYLLTRRRRYCHSRWKAIMTRLDRAQNV